MNRRFAVALFVVLASSGPVQAHGLRLQVEAKGACLVGQVSYSDGWPGAGEVVRVADADTRKAAERTVTADDQGHFSLPVDTGRTYRVTVSGDEEHEVHKTVEVEPLESDPSPKCPTAQGAR